MSTSSKTAPVVEANQVAEFRYSELSDKNGAPWGSQKDQRQREEDARQAGIREGESRAQASYEAKLQELRKESIVAIETFARERREYFLAAEREAVQLACGIARKILRRESTLDPLLLAGMVRVALEHISQATRVTVSVHPQHVSDFRVFFARTMQENPPEIIEDPSLDLEQCVLHTELGTTEVGPEIQLKEIEQGLLDLQAAKPHIAP